MLVAEVNKLKEYYRKLNMAYTSVFTPHSLSGGDVLDDLAKFCRAGESTFHPDPRVHALLEGRREVYLRIQDLLTLNHEQLLAKHTKALNTETAT